MHEGPYYWDEDYKRDLDMEERYNGDPTTELKEDELLKEEIDLYLEDKKHNPTTREI